MIESFKLPTIIPETLTGSICSFNDEYGGLPLKSCTSLITGYQEGSGTPSPSNVRPLHAFSSGSFVNDDGNNILDNSLLENSYSWKTLNFVGEPNTEYVMTSDLPNNDVIKMFILSGGESYPVNTHSPQTVISQSNGRITIQYRNLNTTDYDIANYNFYVKKGNSYTFTFGQSIYQGSIDWKRGVVVGNEVVFNAWNTLSFYYNSSQHFYYAEISNMLANNDSTRSNIYNYVDDKSWVRLVDYEFGVAGIQIRLHNETVSSSQELVNLLISQGVEIKYPLATPITIPLGGINLLTQQGQNNIYCDTGDTEVKWLHVN